MAHVPVLGVRQNFRHVVPRGFTGATALNAPEPEEQEPLGKLAGRIRVVLVSVVVPIYKSGLE